MVQLCLLCAWWEFGGIFWTCGVCVCVCVRSAGLGTTIEPLYVISIKYSSSLPDDGSYVIRNMLEYFNVCLLDFCII